jgi:hypothetical protein
MSFEEQAQATLETAISRLRDEMTRELQLVAAELSAHARRDREAAVEQAAGTAATVARAHVRATDLIASRRLVEAIRALDRASSLSEVLDALVDMAAREAARVCLLLTSRGGLRAWRFAGFGETSEGEATAVPIEKSGIIAEAIRTGSAVSSDDPSGPLAAPAFAELPPGCDSLAVPVAMSGEVVAVLYADQRQGDRPQAAAIAWPDAVEILARHAARCLEARTAIEAVRVLSERPEPRAEPETSDTDEVEDEAASKYARLLISEIKLDHEAAVIAGRQERDLADRLAGQISRARTLYERRVRPQTRARRDHFHAELVRTLADGDAKLLGRTPAKPEAKA